LESDKVNVLIIDDSMSYRAILFDVFKDINGVGTISSASNGKVALEMIAYKQPDMITLDINMPVMDGFETLRNISKEYPDIGVVMISSANIDSADKTLRALIIGCIEFIVKPSFSDHKESKAHLSGHLTKVVNIIQSRRKAKLGIGPDISSSVKSTPYGKRKIEKPRIVELIVIGSSTGGPKALERIIPGLPTNFSVPILIVQHMPKYFTQSLAKILDEKSSLPISEGKDFDPIEPGHVYISPGGVHLTASWDEDKNSHMIRLNNRPKENSCRPSIDPLLRSAGKVYGPKQVLCVILTGVGNDGSKGVQSLQEMGGGYCLIQSSDTCVADAMPLSIVAANLEYESVDLDGRSDKIIQISCWR